MMFKKIISALLMLMCLCAACSGALAVDATILEEPAEEEVWRSVTARAVVGDTLYLLMNGTDGHELFYWKEDMPQAEKLADNLFFAGYYSAMDEVESVIKADEKAAGLVDPQYALSLMFSDGERLMGMNGYNGKIFTMTVEEGKVVYQDVAQVKDTSLMFHKSEDYQYLLSANQYAVAGGKLLYLVEDYTDEGMQDNRLLVIDLSSGEVTRSKVEYPHRVTEWKDGKAVLICRDDMNAYNAETGEMVKPALNLYDPATDTVQSMGEMPEESMPYVTYSAALNALVYAQNCRIMAMVDLGQPQQVGYIPADWTYNLAAVGSTFVDCPNQVIGRTMSLDYKSDVYLNVYGDYMDQGTMAFTRKYPQVPVYTMNEYYDSLEQISQAMVSGDTTIDVLRMNTGYSSFFRLMEKGYCADLSGNKELMAYVERMQPAFRDAVMKDGKLYAIPLRAYSFDGWYVANGVMEDMGLTIEDIPTNYVELCQFATRWNDEWVEEYPQYTLIEYTDDYKAALLNYMVEDYLNYCTAKGQQVRFNTPEFRAMLEALEAMRTDDLTRGANLENEDEVGYRQGLLMPNYTVVGSFDTDNKYRTFIPMTLTPDTDYVTGVELELAFINPRCANMTEAQNLLLCKLQSLEEDSRTNAYTIFTDLKEPVENAYYQRNLESMEKAIQRMEAQLAELPEEEKKDYQMMIDEQKAWNEDYKANERWEISAEAIARYDEQIVPYMYVKKPTFMIGSRDSASPELNTLLERYRAGQIKLEQFIRDADNKIMMMQMEDY
ncbi:MAG: hypothetical protein IJX84_06120 [Clostridia bacterium]|nr:hypothetical protein [Clostridia bacterium]